MLATRAPLAGTLADEGEEVAQSVAAVLNEANRDISGAPGQDEAFSGLFDVSSTSNLSERG